MFSFCYGKLLAPFPIFGISPPTYASNHQLSVFLLSAACQHSSLLLWFTKAEILQQCFKILACVFQIINMRGQHDLFPCVTDSLFHTKFLARFCFVSVGIFCWPLLSWAVLSFHHGINPVWLLYIAYKSFGTLWSFLHTTTCWLSFQASINSDCLPLIRNLKQFPSCCQQCWLLHFISTSTPNDEGRISYHQLRLEPGSVGHQK